MTAPITIGPGQGIEARERSGVTNYRLECEPSTGFVKCGIFGFLDEAEAATLAATLYDLILQIRRLGRPLRLLIDNHQGAVFSPAAADAFGALRKTADPRDRTAVVVASSLHKLQAKRNAGVHTELFISESAAMTWLMAWDQEKPADQGK
jgi:hypothetical protein